MPTRSRLIKREAVIELSAERFGNMIGKRFGKVKIFCQLLTPLQHPIRFGGKSVTAKK